MAQPHRVRRYPRNFYSFFVIFVSSVETSTESIQVSGRERVVQNSQHNKQRLCLGRVLFIREDFLEKTQETTQEWRRNHNACRITVCGCNASHTSLVKLVFKNAFNSIRCDRFLTTIADEVPELSFYQLLLPSSKVPSKVTRFEAYCFVSC